MPLTVGRIEWVEEPGRFKALAEQWERLAREADSPFGDHVWFGAWWAAFGTGSLRICTLWEDGELQAALPLAVHRGALRALANFHTPAFVAPAREGEALVRVVDEALDQSANEVAVQGVDLDGPLHEALLLCSAGRGRQVLVEQLYRSPRVDVSGDFEHYARTRGRPFKELRRRWRKLNREHDTRFRFEDSPTELAADLQAGFEIEASGWKGRQKTAILSSPQTESFYTAIASAYLARGELRLAWLDVDGRPAAFAFCLQRRGRLYLLKLGIDDRLRPLSPGLLIDYCLTERCFELGIERFELLGADDAYKSRFATARADIVRLRSYRRRPVGVARYMTRRVARPAVLAARERLGRKKARR